MNGPPSLRFRFLANDDSRDGARPAESEPPPSSRRNRLTARQEWVEAELEQSSELRRFDAA